MRKIIYLGSLIILLVVSISFAQETTSESGEKVIAEGIVKNLIAGGTREISYHSGYYLSDPTWLITPSKTNNIFFFSFARNMKEYLDKKVHVEGTVKYVKGKKYSEMHYSAGHYFQGASVALYSMARNRSM